MARLLLLVLVRSWAFRLLALAGYRVIAMTAETNKLRRQNGIIAGVCGGLGEFFGISPWVFRIIFLFLLLPGGLPGLLPYLLLWIAIPPKR